MSVLSLRRFALLLLIVIPLLSFQCQTTGHSRYGECTPTGFARPVITVNQATLTAHQQVAVVWDVEPDGRDANGCLRRSNTPVTITWKTDDPNFRLDVAFVTHCPIPKPNCETPGECTVRVPTFKTPNAQPYRCTYEMYNRTDGAQKDVQADIVVIPCCM